MTSLSRTASRGKQTVRFDVRVTDMSGNNRMLMDVRDLRDLKWKIRQMMGFPKGDKWIIVEDRTGCVVTKNSGLLATNGFLSVVNTTRGEKWTRPGFCCHQPFERLDSGLIKSQPPGNEPADHQLAQSRMCGSPTGTTIIVGSIQAQQVHLGNNNTAVTGDLACENTEVKQPC